MCSAQYGTVIIFMRGGCILLQRSKSTCIESVCDLVSIIQAEGKSLEEFAMIAWLIWIRRNKLRHNEPALLVSKLAQSALTLLHEFQQGKQRKESQTRVGPVRW